MHQEGSKKSINPIDPAFFKQAQSTSEVVSPRKPLLGPNRKATEESRTPSQLTVPTIGGETQLPSIIVN